MTSQTNEQVLERKLREDDQELERKEAQRAALVSQVREQFKDAQTPDFTEPLLARSRFERKELEHQNQRLTYWTERTAEKDSAAEDSVRLENLSFRQLARNTSQAVIDTFTDINTMSSDEVKSLGGWLGVFSRKDRLVYFGLLLVAIAFLVYLVDL